MRHVEDMVNRQINRWNYMLQVLKYDTDAQGEASHEIPAKKISEDHPVICLSRDLGAGAREIAHLLCARLGYELFGKNIINHLAEDMNVQRRLIDSLDEHARGDMELMLETFLRGRQIDNQEYLASLGRVVNTLAIQGGVVILGRGASFVLGARSALNVMITAPLDDRVARVMEYESQEEKAARKLIEQSDRDRKHFIHRFFGADLRDTSHYDLCINTGRIAPEAAVELILRTLELRGYSAARLHMPTPA